MADPDDPELIAQAERFLGPSRKQLVADAERLLASLTETERLEVMKPYDLGFIRANALLLGRAIDAERALRELEPRVDVLDETLGENAGTYVALRARIENLEAWSHNHAYE
jgi:hypothetical protein